MGQSSSSASLPSADPRVPYFALTFQTPDKLTLALADKSIIELTQKAIAESVSSEESNHHDTFIHCEGRTDMNVYEFKFRGFPFMRGCGQNYSLRSKRMCCLMLEMYREHGWILDLASDLSRGKETTTWFFRRENDQKQGMENGYRSSSENKKRVLCVSVCSGDTIQLINGSEITRRLLARAVRDGYAVDGIKTESLTYDGDHEIQLIDQAWTSPDPIIGLKVRRLLLEIVRSFETAGGFRFYGTVNTKGTSDSLFFIAIDDDQDFEIDRGYFAVSLNNGGCIDVIDAPSSDVDEAVLRAIVRFWPTKLHSQTVLDKGAHEFRLKGNPWYATGGDEAIAARVFICGLLETLHIDGYEPLTALDVTRGLSDKALFIFRSKHSINEVRSPQQRAAFLLNESSQPYWCISLQDEAKVRLINAPENLKMPVRHAIDQIWPWGIQKENSFHNDDGYLFKLKAGPWGAEQHENMAALMSYVLKVLNDQGCRAVLSADVTGRYVSNNHGGSHSLDVHSWFLTCDVCLIQHKPKGFPLVLAKRNVERRYSNALEDDEADEELSPLKPMGGSTRKERPRRKVSAVEYTSYVVNAKESEEDKDTVAPLKKSEAPAKKQEKLRRKVSAFEYTSYTMNAEN